MPENVFRESYDLQSSPALHNVDDMSYGKGMRWNMDTICSPLWEEEWEQRFKCPDTEKCTSCLLYCHQQWLAAPRFSNTQETNRIKR